MKIYVAGKITNLDNYRERFEEATKMLEAEGHSVMNPAVLPYPGFEHHEYLKICYAMIDVCDCIFFIDNWKTSKGARMEYQYAKSKNKLMMYQGGPNRYCPK